MWWVDISIIFGRFASDLPRFFLTAWNLWLLPMGSFFGGPMILKKNTGKMTSQRLVERNAWVLCASANLMRDFRGTGWNFAAFSAEFWDPEFESTLWKIHVKNDETTNISQLVSWCYSLFSKKFFRINCYTSSGIYIQIVILSFYYSGIFHQKLYDQSDFSSSNDFYNSFHLSDRKALRSAEAMDGGHELWWYQLGSRALYATLMRCRKVSEL